MSILIADILTLLSALAATVAVAGVARGRSVYVQIHAASLVMMVGAMVVLAAALTTGKGDIIGRAILVAAFLLLTTPVSSHALARLHHHTDAGRQPPSDHSGSDAPHTSGASPG